MICNFGEVKLADAGPKAPVKRSPTQVSTDYRRIVLWKSNKKAADDVKKGSGPSSAHSIIIPYGSSGPTQNAPAHKVK